MQEQRQLHEDCHYWCASPNIVTALKFDMQHARQKEAKCIETTDRCKGKLCR
jgi:hypothetical protein